MEEKKLFQKESDIASLEKDVLSLQLNIKNRNSTISNKLRNTIKKHIGETEAYRKPYIRNMYEKLHGTPSIRSTLKNQTRK